MKPSRVEIIDHRPEGEGRVFVAWEDDLEVDVVYQDDGRTVKIFLNKKV